MGLVTRDEFVQKRDTIKERLEEEAKKQRLEREEQEFQVCVWWWCFGGGGKGGVTENSLGIRREPTYM